MFFKWATLAFAPRSHVVLKPLFFSYGLVEIILIWLMTLFN